MEDKLSGYKLAQSQLQTFLPEKPNEISALAVPETIIFTKLQTHQRGFKMKIKMVSIYVDDVEKAFRFYTEVLGFKEKLHTPEYGLAIVVSPEDPDGTALLLEPNENSIAKNYQTSLFRAGIPVMVFGTDDIYRDYERLKQKGVKFRGEPRKTEWGLQVDFEDTCGNLIRFHQDLQAR